MVNRLKGMSRRELLELLVAQMEENEKLKTQLNEAEARLRERTIVLENAGSIAQAALQLNKVFEAAEQAAAQYQSSCEEAARKKAADIMAEADKYSEAVKNAAENCWKIASEKSASSETENTDPLLPREEQT